ncbi:MAG: aminopeptidase P family protein [bacterium]
MKNQLITTLPNIFYLSGFSGSFAYLLIQGKKKILYTDSRYEIQAKNEVKGCRVKIFDTQAAMFADIALLIKSRGRAVLEVEDKISLREYQVLKKILKVKIITADRWIEERRMIKTKREIAIMRAGAKKLAKVARRLKVVRGMRESDLVMEISKRARRLGMGSPAFEAIVASGKRGALPHGLASEKKFRPGDMVVVDFGFYYKGYATDMTRTYFVGQPSKKQIEVYAAVAAAQDVAIHMIRDNMPAVQVDKVARDLLNRAGFKKYFRHALGHGVGVSVHEKPRVSPDSKDILRAGMVVTVEPGIYIEGWGGVRIEDMVLVKERGFEVLTR